MHYKNGREAKNGDKVVVIPRYPHSTPAIGILYDAGVNTCNGRLAPISQLDLCPNLGECLRLDDALALLNPNVVPVSNIPNTEPPPTEPQAAE